MTVLVILACGSSLAHVPPSGFTYGVAMMPSRTDWFVSVSGSDGNGGTSWEDAFGSIGQASSVAGPGDVVAVGPGRYEGAVTTWASGSSGERVAFVSATPGGALIDASGSSSAWRNHGSYVDIIGFEVTGSDYGGIVNYGSYVRVIGNEVHDLAVPSCNEPNGGAAINHADYDGEGNETIGNMVYNVVPPGPYCNLVHGIYHSNRGGAVQNNIIFNVSGTGVHTWHGATGVTITNNLVFGANVGIGVSGDDLVAENYLVANNILVHNRFGISEGGRLGANNRYRNNLVFGNDYNYSLETGSASGWIVEDPAFVDFRLDGSGDYRLASGSPAIDAGITEGAPATDIDGTPRPRLDAVDIGPYEAGQP